MHSRGTSGAAGIGVWWGFDVFPQHTHRSCPENQGAEQLQQVVILGLIIYSLKKQRGFELAT